MLRFFKRSKSRRVDEEQDSKGDESRRNGGGDQESTFASRFAFRRENGRLQRDSAAAPEKLHEQRCEDGERLQVAAADDNYNFNTIRAVPENRTAEPSGSYNETAIDAARTKSSGSFLIDIMGKGRHRRGGSYHGGGGGAKSQKRDAKMREKKEKENCSGTSLANYNASAPVKKCDEATAEIIEIGDEMAVVKCECLGEESDENELKRPAEASETKSPDNSEELVQNNPLEQEEEEEEEKREFSPNIAITSDEMGQPNSKNNGQQTNYRSPSQSPLREASSGSNSSNATATSRGSSSSSVKTVRFSDTNLVTTIPYFADNVSVDDVFFEAETTGPPLVESEESEDEDDLVSAIEYSEDQVSVQIENCANNSEAAKNTETLESEKSGEQKSECAFSDESADLNSFSDESEDSQDPAIEQENLKNTEHSIYSDKVEEAPEAPDSEVKGSLMEESVSLPDLVESSHQLITEQPKVFPGEEKCNGIDKIEEMRDFLNHESKFRVELEAAEKKAAAAQAKVDELKTQIYELERDIQNKAGLGDRLQAELEASNKESDCVRHKLRQQGEELEKLRRTADDATEEWRVKYQDLETGHAETEEKLKTAQKLTTNLQIQIANVKSETEKCQLEKEKLMQEKMEEQKVLREALEKALKERSELEVKWKKDFEQIRNVNSEREERLMEDCEWKMRSMQKQCKEKIDTAEKEKKEAVQRMTDLQTEWTKHSTEIEHIKAYEAELKQLRGLTNDQHESIQAMRKQVETIKAELEVATGKLQEEIENCQEIKRKSEWELQEKERQAVHRIDVARGTIAMQWEDKLLEEMARLKTELEQIGLEDKQAALSKLKAECDDEISGLKARFDSKQKELEQEVAGLKGALARKQTEFNELQAKTDSQIVESRMFVQRAERESQVVLDREIAKREAIIDSLKQDYAKEKQQMETGFRTRLEQVQEEFARELTDSTEILKANHKRELEEQWKQLIAEKEEALQAMEARHRKKIDEAENQIRELVASHDRTLNDLQEAHTMERSSLEKRDSKNVQEIDTLHKKCRCLTKLFEEMRMRYERRDPRPEDLRQITELKNIVDAQDRDLRILTERLREMQMYQQHHQMQQGLPPYGQVMPPQYPHHQQGMPPPPRKSKSRTPVQQNGHPLPPPPPMLLTPEQIAMQKHLACDVIYEENEEGEVHNGMNGKHTNGDHIDAKALVGDILNDVVGSVNVQAHGLAESAF